MKNLKKAPQYCSVEAAEKWYHKFTQILQRLEEPASVHNSLAYKVNQIKQIAQNLLPQAGGEGDAVMSLYLEIQGSHFTSWLHNIAINFRAATKADAIVKLEEGSCQALHDYFGRFEADLEREYMKAVAGLNSSDPCLEQIRARLAASAKKVPVANRFSLARRRSNGRA